MFCGNCGSKLEDDVKICPYCGATCNGTNTAQAMGAPGPLNQQNRQNTSVRNAMYGRKNGKTLYLCMIGASAIVIVIVLAVVCLHKKPIGILQKEANQGMQADNSYGEEEAAYPNEEDYDEIILSDERYFFCKKNVSGFEGNEDYYGVYDNELKEWIVDFIALPQPTDAGALVSIEPNNQVYNFGEGMFGYTLSYDGNMCTCFLSPDMGGKTFILNLDNEPVSTTRFVNGSAFVLEYVKFKGYDEGHIPPDSRLCKLYKDGTLEEVSIPSFSNDKVGEYCYWFSCFVHPKDDTKVFAAIFSVEDNYYLYVYLFDDDKAVIIDDNAVIKRIKRNSIYEYQSDDTIISVDGDKIVLEQLLGDDGNFYRREYDIQEYIDKFAEKAYEEANLYIADEDYEVGIKMLESVSPYYTDYNKITEKIDEAKQLSIAYTDENAEQVFLSDLEQPQDTAAKSLTSEKDVTLYDKTGKRYKRCIEYRGGRDWWSGSSTYDERDSYILNGDYSKFRSTVFVPQDRYEYWDTDINQEEIDTGSFTLRIFGDEKLLYQSPLLLSDHEPIEINVDVTGVNTLSFSWATYDDVNAEIGLADPYVIK